MNAAAIWFLAVAVCLAGVVAGEFLMRRFGLTAPANEHEPWLRRRRGLADVRTYKAVWARADGEPNECRGLTPRVLTSRLMKAVASSGPITVIEVSAETTGPRTPHGRAAREQDGDRSIETGRPGDFRGGGAASCGQPQSAVRGRARPSRASEANIPPLNGTSAPKTPHDDARPQAAASTHVGQRPIAHRTSAIGQTKRPGAQIQSQRARDAR